MLMGVFGAGASFDSYAPEPAREGDGLTWTGRGQESNRRAAALRLARGNPSDVRLTGLAVPPTPSLD